MAGNEEQVQQTAQPRWWALPLLGVLWLSSAVYALRTTLNHDVAWYLFATNRVLNGARLYRDIVDVNPPLVFYESVPPVVMARLTRLQDVTCLMVYVFLLIGLSLAISHHLLKAQTDRSAGYRVGMLFAAYAALVPQGLSVLGQREHLLIILSLPYLVLLTSRFAGYRSGTLEAFAIGVLSVFGFALKPYFAMVPAGVELYLMIQRRSLLTWLRPECLGLGAGLMAYSLVLYLFHPEYLTFIVPAARLTYGADEAPFRTVLMKPSVAPILLGTILYGLGRRAHWADRRGDVFLVATAGFFASYLIQEKGWTYHLYPTLAMIWLALANLVLLRMSVVQSRAQLALVMLTAAWAGQLILIPVLGGPYHNGVADRMLPIVSHYARGGTIYAFTSNTWVGFPLVNEARVQWGSRFGSQWLLPGVVRQLASTRVDPTRRTKIEEIGRYQTGAVIEDFERWAPDLVIVAERDRVDFLAYYLADARFEPLWRGYVRIGAVQVEAGGRLRPFGIWCRTTGPIPCDPLGSTSR